MAKIYAVKKGLVPGIYNTWSECEKQVKGYSGAEYKSFKDTQMSEAIDFVGIENLQVESSQSFERFIEPKSLNEQELNVLYNIDPGFSPAHSSAYAMDTLATAMIKKFYLNDLVDIYTDGSYKNGRYSYGFVVVKDGVIIHTDNGVGTDTKAASMQNVAGELSGAMHAVKWAYDNGYKCRIYHDYEGVGKWVTGIWKARNRHTQSYVEFMEEYKPTIDRFVWVRGHSGNKFNSLADRLAGDALH